MAWKRFCRSVAEHFKSLFLRKPMHAVQSEIHYNQSLRPAVTRVQMIGLGIGGIIGESDSN